MRRHAGHSSQTSSAGRAVATAGRPVNSRPGALSAAARGCAALALVGVLGSLPARGQMNISVTYDPSVPAAAQTAFKNVVSLYTSTFVNPMTAKIYITFAGTQLGGSTTSFVELSYANWRTDMMATSALYPQNNYLSTGNGTLGVGDPIGNGSIFVRSADSYAIGVTAGQTTRTFFQTNNSVRYDSILTFSAVTNTFSYTGAATPNRYDFLSVASHELNEALGIGSQLTGKANNAALPTEFEPEDYYRYDANGNRSITTDPNAAVYFTYDPTLAVYPDRFNQDNNKGDRNDWIWGNSGVPSATVEVQNAIGWTNQAAPLLTASPTTSEFQVLSTLGYSVPEPAAVPLVGMGAVAVWTVRRWRRNRL